MKSSFFKSGTRHTSDLAMFIITSGRDLDFVTRKKERNMDDQDQVTGEISLYLFTT